MRLTNIDLEELNKINSSVAIERIILDDYENAYCEIVTDDQGEAIRFNIYSSITMQHMFLSVPVK